MINKLFVGPDKKGNYTLRTSDPEFVSHKDHYDKSWGRQESQGVPYSVLLYETFRGNEPGLQRAISDGEVREPCSSYLDSLLKPKVTLISLHITAMFLSSYKVPIKLAEDLP